MSRVLVIDPLFDDEPDIERQVAGPDIELVFRKAKPGGHLGDEDYRGVTAVLNCRSAHTIPAAILEKLESCRLIQQGGVGYGHVDIAAAGAMGIPVCNTPDYGTTEVADHAVALALSLVRGVQAYDRRLRRGNESWDARSLPTVRRLPGLRVGIVGLGRIGTAAALRFQAFRMQVGFFDPHLPVGVELSYGWERFQSLDGLMRRSDLVTVHCPVSDETRGLIGAPELALLPPGAVIINTARGGIVDIDAVHAALTGGRLGGAGLDVFETEPLDRRHPLISAWAANEPWLDDRLILTPHAAFYSVDSLKDIRRLSMTYLTDYLRTGILRTCVNAPYLTHRR